MHEEALTKEAAAILPHFKRFQGFYLVGGTALALQMGHRVSVDFDFFSSDALQKNLLQRVKRIFRGYPIQVTYRAVEQLNITIGEVKTTFFHYEYPVLRPFMSYKDVSIATVDEIATMKAFSLGKRLAYKDYVDWYFMLKEDRVDLKEIIILAQKKFGNDFNDRLFLGQLVSLEDIPTQKIDFLREEPSRAMIGRFLKTAVGRYEI